MIIFDDYEFVRLLMDGEAPHPCIYRNSVLRSCAKLIDRGDYEFNDILNKLNEVYPRFNVNDELLAQYVENRTLTPPYKPHLITFGLGELKAIHSLPRKSERKLYLCQLFAFKYFGVKRLRIAHREFKRMAGLNLNHYPISEMHMGHGISIRREDNHKGNIIIADYSTNKPYTYYYPTMRSGKSVFSFLYEGDSYMLPSSEFESNLSELWDKYREAEHKWL